MPLKTFTVFLQTNRCDVHKVADVACDMSPVFIEVATDQAQNSSVTVDWGFTLSSCLPMRWNWFDAKKAKKKRSSKGAHLVIPKGDLVLNDNAMRLLENLMPLWLS